MRGVKAFWFIRGGLVEEIKLRLKLIGRRRRIFYLPDAAGLWVAVVCPNRTVFAVAVRRKELYFFKGKASKELYPGEIIFGKPRDDSALEKYRGELPPSPRVLPFFVLGTTNAKRNAKMAVNFLEHNPLILSSSWSIAGVRDDGTIWLMDGYRGPKPATYDIFHRLGVAFPDFNIDFLLNFANSRI